MSVHGCCSGSGGCSVGFASGTFPLCYCVPSVFCRKRPSGDFAKPSWTVLSKRRLRTGVDVQVLEGIFEAGFETFLLRSCDQIEHLS